MSLSTKVWQGSVWQGSVWNGGVGLPVSGWSPTDIPQEEADALKAFWRSTGGPNWTNKWTFGETAGDLYGVTVSGGNVTVIAVGDNNLSADDIDLDMSVFALTEAGTDGVLSSLVSASAANTTLDISGSAHPSATGLADISTLIADGWTITVSDNTMSVTADNTHVATKDGEAMLFIEGVDISDYANTGLEVTLKSGTGTADETAVGYAYTAGGGLAYEQDGGSDKEYVVDGGFTEACGVNWLCGSGWTISSGEAVATTVSTDKPIYQNTLSSSFSGSLLSYTFDVNSVTLNGVRLELDYNPISAFSSTITTAGSHSGIRTPKTTIFNRPLFRAHGGNFSGTIDNLSIKKIIDVSSTGIHLVSTATGAIRNMASVGADFDPNDIEEITIGGTAS